MVGFNQSHGAILNQTTTQLAETQDLAANQSANQAVPLAQKQNKVFGEGFRNRTKGESLFNKISYFGFGYVLTTAVSIAMTWALADNKRLGPKYKEITDPIFAKLKIPESFRSISTLFIGGTVASVLPVKWLEDSKKTLVHKFDRLYYTDEQIANDPTIQQAYKALDAEPKQTWLSVFSSRVVAFAATFTVFKLMGSNESLLARKTGESIDKRSTQAGRYLDKLFSGNNAKIVAEVEEAAASNLKAVEATKELPMGAKGKVSGIEVMRDNPYGAPDRIRSRIWSYITLDAFYTAITSSTLFVFTRILAPIMGKKSQVPEAAVAVDTAKPVVQETAPAVEERPVAKTKDHAPEPTHAPRTSVSQTTHHERVSAAPVHQEVTA